MKVVVDATMLDGRPSGAATRLACLGAEHRRRGVVDVLHLVRPGCDPLPGLACEPFADIDTPWGRSGAGRRLDAFLAGAGADLFMAGALPLPAVRSVPQVLTLHDLRFLAPDGGQGLLRRLWARVALRRNLRRAQHVVSVSRSTQDELVARGLLAPERVAVVSNAGSPGLERVEDVQRIAAFRQQAGISGRYVLALGPLEPHKHVEDLIEVLGAVHQHPLAHDLALVVAGRADPRQAFALARYAARLGVADVFRVVGVLDDEQLAAALSGADALVSAGRHEGFAIPVVDAQAIGVPVVAVDSGALPEVGADGAWLSGPDDLAGFGAAILDATTPSDMRDARLRRGQALAERWSWRISAENLETLWKGLIEGVAPRNTTLK